MFAMDWMFYAYMETLNLKVIVLGGGTFGGD